MRIGRSFLVVSRRSPAARRRPVGSTPLRPRGVRPCSHLLQSQQHLAGVDLVAGRSRAPRPPVRRRAPGSGAPSSWPRRRPAAGRRAPRHPGRRVTRRTAPGIGDQRASGRRRCGADAGQHGEHDVAVIGIDGTGRRRPARRRDVGARRRARPRRWSGCASMTSASSRWPSTATNPSPTDPVRHRRVRPSRRRRLVSPMDCSTAGLLRQPEGICRQTRAARAIGGLLGERRRTPPSATSPVIGSVHGCRRGTVVCQVTRHELRMAEDAHELVTVGRRPVQAGVAAAPPSGCGSPRPGSRRGRPPWPPSSRSTAARWSRRRRRCRRAPPPGCGTS